MTFKQTSKLAYTHTHTVSYTEKKYSFSQYVHYTYIHTRARM